jgi:hypothetical protein
MTDLAVITAEDFERWATQPFLVHLSTGGRLPVDVAGVKRQRLPGGSAREPFSVLFTAPLDVPLVQNIHRLEHPEAGVLEMLLVPLQPEDGHALYQAVFA